MFTRANRVAVSVDPSLGAPGHRMPGTSGGVIDDDPFHGMASAGVS